MARLLFLKPNDGFDPGTLLGLDDPRDKVTQLILSAALGLTTFVTFCILRLKWTSLYAARKKHKNEASVLPDLPRSMFGWMPTLWRINDQQILASAGLDAYVFLAFFKLAIKFLLFAFFFSLTIIKPVHDAYQDEPDDSDNPDTNNTVRLVMSNAQPSNGTSPFLEGWDPDYLWMYVVLAYLFSIMAIYLIISETRHIIKLRQDFLGAKTSVTDRTIRLSGIPPDLQDEERIKELIENLDIGKVESVTLCRKWKELDDAIETRMDTLRRLEEAYTLHLGRKRVGRNLATLPIVQPLPPPRTDETPFRNDVDAENGDRLHESDLFRTAMDSRPRPKTRVRYGWWKLKSKEVDAINHFEEKLRATDERIKELRQKTFDPTSLAFVTMDCVASCQMAIQAVLDPSPQLLIASQSPSPADVMWQNTYLSRRRRMLRSWSITTLILFLTIFWLALFVPIVLTLNVEILGKLFPDFKHFLGENDTLALLLRVPVPTLLTSLLMILVQYLYYYLSWYQGMTSQGDIELSAISKNFFFSFFNFFVPFTVLGTAATFYDLAQHFGEILREPTAALQAIALSLQRYSHFYVNFIILQGIGLLPMRLLELGSVSLYPVYRIGAKTPRDYAELVQPPIFSYAFYLPNALLIFIICMAYSVLRSSWQILLAGLVFFSFGHFVYKYQLLYAMDHRQQAGGRAWGMICDRLFVGLVFFQVTTAGQLIARKAVTRSVLMIPLVVATIWIAVAYDKTFKPLLIFISLRSIKRGQPYQDHVESNEHSEASEASSIVSMGTDMNPERNVWAENERSRSELRNRARRGRVYDETDDASLKFINPSLVVPLEKLWIADQHPDIDDVEVGQNDSGNGNGTI